MAKKTLNEAVVRRFQKLANVAPINEMYMKEEEADAELAPADDMEMGAPEGEEMPMDDADMGEGESELELAQSDIKAIAAALPALQTIAAAAGDDMGEEGEEMDDMDMDAELPAGEEDEEDLGGDDIMEALRGISYQPSQSEIVNEVAQRVARRLKAAKLHEAKLNRALGRRK
jgi:hypothetical protein